MVIIVASVDRHRGTDPIRQEAARRLNGGELIIHRNIGRSECSLAGIKLTDLERVTASLAVQCHFGLRIIHGELVIAESAVDDDAFHSAVIESFHVRDTVDQRHKSGSTTGPSSQQELIGERSSRDGEQVGIHCGTCVQHDTQRAGFSTSIVDQVNIAATFSIKKITPVPRNQHIIRLGAVHLRTAVSPDPVAGAAAVEPIFTGAAIKRIIMLVTKN